MALFSVLKIETDSLFSFTSFSFLHFPVNMELVLKSVLPTVQNISEKSIISCRSPWIYLTFGVTMLTYYLEEIDER